MEKADIGIICAMNVEVEGLSAAMTDKEVMHMSSIEFICGKIADKKVVMAVCGIGKVFAALCTQTMILGFSPDIIINSGIAGTLTGKLAIGDAAIALKAVQHDIDTTALGDEPGMIAGLNMVYVPTDENVTNQLAECVRGLKIKCETGTIATGDQFINDSKKKAELVRKFGAIACEMEGGAIAQVCYVNKVPFSILRVISDGGDDNSHLDYAEFKKLASEKSVQIMKSFVEKYKK